VFPGLKRQSVPEKCSSRIAFPFSQEFGRNLFHFGIHLIVGAVVSDVLLQHCYRWKAADKIPLIEWIVTREEAKPFQNAALAGAARGSSGPARIRLRSRRGQAVGQAVFWLLLRA
jgi:hypothetical protein